MATIVKRGKIYSIVYRDPLTGKQKWKSVGTDRKVAELALADLMLKLDRIKAGLEPVHRNIRTQDFVREFLDDVDHSKSKSWGKRYQQVIGRFLDFVTDENIVYLHEIAPAHIQRYKNIRAEQVKPRTVNLELCLIGVLFGQAVEFHYLEENPVKKVSKVREAPRNPRFLSLDEIDGLLRYSRPEHRPIWLAFIHTGMRAGELQNLEW